MKPFCPIPSKDGLPYIIAHRGLSVKFPENTLISFEKAANVLGVDMIELDVRLTKDGEVVVIHDHTLQRTTTGNGFVRNYLLREIKQLDAGSWFHPSFSDQRIPTLEEVLRLVGHKVWIDIELKSDFFCRKRNGILERKVLDIVQKCSMNNRVLFSSFDHDMLINIKKMQPEARVGILYNFPFDFGKTPSELAKKVDACVFVCSKREITYEMVRDAHKSSIAVYVYTLNSISSVKRVMEYEVDGIMSDNADEILNVIRQEKITFVKN